MVSINSVQRTSSIISGLKGLQSSTHLSESCLDKCSLLPEKNSDGLKEKQNKTKQENLKKTQSFTNIEFFLFYFIRKIEM